MRIIGQQLDHEEALREVLQRYWGYDGFLPLQREAMIAALSGSDSVVVLPTGGGKSLCFQAPALLARGLAVVVSPLISLMKDQVDSLRACGVAAASVNSMLALDERREVADEIRAGHLRLLYISPDRLLADRTLEFLRSVGPTLFAIDEAHCISSWGTTSGRNTARCAACGRSFPACRFTPIRRLRRNKCAPTLLISYNSHPRKFS